MRAGLGRSGGEEMPLVGDALEDMRASVLERQAEARHEIPDGPRHQHLTGTRKGCDPGADVDGQTTDVVAGELDLARVDARPSLKPQRPDGVRPGECAADGPGGAGG